MKNRIDSLVISGCFFLLLVFAGSYSPISAAPRYVDNFENGMPQLDGGSGWNWTNLAPDSMEHTADVTTRAGKILENTTGRLSTTYITDGNWGDWQQEVGGHFYLGLYIWSCGEGGTFNIRITEEDYYYGAEAAHLPVEEVWELVEDPDGKNKTLDWTGWKYKMYQLPAFEAEYKSEKAWGYGFAPDPSIPDYPNSDHRWNPEYVAASGDPEEKNYRPELRGVKKIELVNGSDNAIYVDEITICEVVGENRWIGQIFPANDVDLDKIDVILDHLPPTISAVLRDRADVEKSKIYVIEEDPTDQTPEEGFSADSLVDDLNNPGDPANMVCFDKKSKTIFVTPNDTPWDNEEPDGISKGEYFVDPGTSKVFTVFVRPADTEGNFGQAEVVTFRVFSSTNNLHEKKVSTGYIREQPY